MVKAILLAVILSFASLAFSRSNPTDQATRERLTVRWLSKALIRMGEKQLANRLMDDYFVNKRVHFRAMNSRDMNAETGPARSGVNEVTFSSDMLFIADLDRVLQKRPYGDRSQLISWAVTIFHEYQHMDQKNPQNLPKWEDPAWKATDKLVSDWSKRLESEYLAASRLPLSKERDAKISEIKDVIQRLNSEIASLREGIDLNLANHSLTADQSWLLDDTQRRLKSILATMEKKSNLEQLQPPKPANTKKGGSWNLVQTKPFDQLAPSDVNYSLTASDGTITSGWRQNNDVFKFTSKWTSPPKQILPTDKVKISMTITIVANAGDQYSANGTLSIWFDRPECEPGSVISPIGLRGDKGESGNIAVTHKLGVPAPTGIDVYIDGKALPTGTPGARIALMVCAYNGRNAGYRYIYEWKDSW